MRQPPATEKQKGYLRFLAEMNRTPIPNLASVSKAQAKSEIERIKIEEERKRIGREDQSQSEEATV